MTTLARLAEKAKQSLAVTAEKISLDEYNWAVTPAIAFGLTVAVITGHQDVIDIDQARYLADGLTDKATSFADYFKRVATFDGERESLTGAGIYLAASASVVAVGTEMLNVVNKIGNKISPGLYQARIQKAAERVVELYSVQEQIGVETLANIVNETSLMRYVSGLDDAKSTAQIFERAAHHYSTSKGPSVKSDAAEEESHRALRM